jgi:hypothetical protein
MRHREVDKLVTSEADESVQSRNDDCQDYGSDEHPTRRHDDSFSG